MSEEKATYITEPLGTDSNRGTTTTVGADLGLDKSVVRKRRNQYNVRPLIGVETAKLIEKAKKELTISSPVLGIIMPSADQIIQAAVKKLLASLSFRETEG